MPIYHLRGLVDSRAPLICADGGGNTALEFGLTPDVIVGDMDSFSKPFDGQIIHLSEQDTTDFEKCLSCGFVQDPDGRYADKAVINGSVQFLVTHSPRLVRLLCTEIAILENGVCNNYEVGNIMETRAT